MKRKIQNTDMVGILREGSDYKKIKRDLVMSLFFEESVIIIVLGELVRKC